MYSYNSSACPLRAEADQADEVRVAEHRQYQHLHQELLPPLHALSGLLLHRHHLCIGSALQEEEESHCADDIIHISYIVQTKE